ncbi:Transcription factor cbf11 [Schizosaccharomyces pombe]
MGDYFAWDFANISGSNTSGSLNLKQLNLDNINNGLHNQEDGAGGRNENSERVGSGSPGSVSMQVLSLFSAVNSALATLEKSEEFPSVVKDEQSIFPAVAKASNSLDELAQNIIPAPSPPGFNRKRKTFDEDSSVEMIRRAISDHLDLLNNCCIGIANLNEDSVHKISLTRSGKPSQLVTVSCRHSSVIQKSYGSEKRYLCPPPMVYINGNYSSIFNQSFRTEISIMNDFGQCSQPISEEYTGQGCMIFRSLHISSLVAAKSKNLRLSLDMFSNVNNQLLSHLVTSSISIVSKPSKKGSKLKISNITLRSGSVVSLYNRINSQTVRTKYTSIEAGQFCLRGDRWVPLRINLLLPDENGKLKVCDDADNPEPIKYGSIVELVDEATGTTSDPLIIRRVEKDHIAEEDGYVNQMHRIVLESAYPISNVRHLKIAEHSSLAYSNNISVRWFLGATSAQNRNASSEAILPIEWESVGNLSSNEMTRVGDSVCWTIVGISHFDCTMMLPFNQNPVPTVTDYPYIEEPPEYLESSRSLQFKIGGYSVGLQIWLGVHGPLSYSFTAAADTSTMGTVTLGLSQISYDPSCAEQKYPLLFVIPGGIVIIGKCEILLTSSAFGN